jgi:hypothetical protein
VETTRAEQFLNLVFKLFLCTWFDHRFITSALEQHYVPCLLHTGLRFDSASSFSSACVALTRLHLEIILLGGGMGSVENPGPFPKARHKLMALTTVHS